MYWQKKKRSSICYCNECIYLDTETANNHEDDLEKLRTWIVSIQVRFNNEYHLFRKPSEFTAWLNYLIKEYRLNPERRIICLIHNSAYDLSYLCPFLQRDLPAEPRSGLFESVSKIVSYSQFCFDFHCTYQLTGMSLEKWSSEMDVEHKKQVGLYDYDKILYQDSSFSDEELRYMEYDTLALEECFKAQLLTENDTPSSVPLTSTGYCRRMFRINALKDRYYREQWFRAGRLDVESYKYCLNSFSGGFTHNNRYLKSRIIDPKEYGADCIGHRDFRSMYPSILRCYPLPFGKPEVFYDAAHKFYRKHPIKIDDILNLYPEYSSISRIRLYGYVELKDKDCVMPFMQDSKLRYTSKAFNYWKDNGRIMKIWPKPGFKYSDKTPICEMYVDNHTLKILKEQYHMHAVVIKVIRFKNYPLPKCLAKTIDTLFKAKTDLKNHYNEMCDKYGKFSSEAIAALGELNRVKRRLNACYGMFATKPVRPEYDLDYAKSPPMQETVGAHTDAEIAEALDKFYNSPNSFLPYQVGVFTTALARAELEEYMNKAVGYKNCIYADTDSIFYLKTPEIEKRIDALNRKKRQTAAYVTAADKTKIYYDVFEQEEDIRYFKGLHSKCYGYVSMPTEKHPNGEATLTIAGIPAYTLIGMKEGIPVYLTREEELAGITIEEKLQHSDDKSLIKYPLRVLTQLSDQTCFKVNTGTTTHYLIQPTREEIINGHSVELCGGAVIRKLREKYIKDIDILDFEIEYSENEEEIIT